MDRRPHFNGVVRDRAAVLERLPLEDQPLQGGRYTLPVLDLLLHVVDRVRRFDVERDRLGYGADPPHTPDQ